MIHFGFKVLKRALWNKTDAISLNNKNLIENVYNMEFIWEPFILSLIAGMATGIGGLFVLMLGRVSDRAVSFSLGFASARAGSRLSEVK